jgi:hypothetical protein
MTITDRALAYRDAFPTQRAAWPWVVNEQGRAVLYARWVIGAAFGNETDLYGAYPRSYLGRVAALFPDVPSVLTLHCFSGSLPPGNVTRLDVRPEAEPDVIGSVYDVAALFAWRPKFQLTLADPPYSSRDAEQYQTRMIDRLRAITALASVTAPGGFLCWLDCVWPQHSKRDWLTVGRIALTRSTNHRARDLSIFERVAA